MENPIQRVPKYVVVRYVGKDRRYSRFVIAERSIGYSVEDPIFTPMAEFRLEEQARKVARLTNADWAMAYVTGDEA